MDNLFLFYSFIFGGVSKKVKRWQEDMKWHGKVIKAAGSKASGWETKTLDSFTTAFITDKTTKKAQKNSTWKSNMLRLDPL